MQADNQQNNYDQRNIDTMEMVYGRGYMSGGGDAEVAKILNGITLNGKRVLDYGCGLGGASVAIATQLHAESVVGLDIDPGLVSRAQVLVNERGVSDRIALVEGTAAGLTFADNEFDVVYVTAVSCHMPDLVTFFSEIKRVVKPGGWIVGSEWFVREDNQAFRNWDDLLRNRGLNFYFVNRDSFESALSENDLSDIAFLDRSEAFTAFAKQSQQKVLNELKPQLIDSLGKAGYSSFVEWTNVRYHGLADGGLSQQHFRARK
jgi:phosphoethanolamine N-methyltransferase